MIIILFFTFILLSSALDLHTIDEYENALTQLKSLRRQIHSLKWIQIEQKTIDWYASYFKTENDRQIFRANIKPDIYELNLTFIKKYKLNEDSTSIDKGLGIRGPVQTGNIFLDLLFTHNNKVVVNKFYRDYIEYRMLEKDFDKLVIQIFSNFVQNPENIENPIEELEQKITCLYKELSLQV